MFPTVSATLRRVSVCQVPNSVVPIRQILILSRYSLGVLVPVVSILEGSPTKDLFDHCTPARKNRATTVTVCKDAHHSFTTKIWFAIRLAAQPATRSLQVQPKAALPRSIEWESGQLNDGNIERRENESKKDGTERPGRRKKRSGSCKSQPREKSSGRIKPLP
ncbi:hypothetical protein C8R42DRAFT_645992 [Lentinula raphanica]|nr:hypothetical protein C8R42DRAFT_645992 [Lentinula raphanica]